MGPPEPLHPPRLTFVYVWGNNPRRAELKGRECVVEARGRMNTILIRFIDTGERVTTSRHAIRPSATMVAPQQERLL